MAAVNTGDYLPAVVGSGIAYGLVAVVMERNSSRWTRMAHKLAAKSDIALPEPLVGRVARFLRVQFRLAGLAGPITGLTVALVPPEKQMNWAAWLPWVVAGLPLVSAGCCCVLGRWPRWTAPGIGLVTHRRPVQLRQAFTSAEVTVTIIGAFVAAAAGAWGLRLVHATPLWWDAWVVAYAVAVLVWWATARSVMSRPSGAGDAIELGWDDVIRFSQVRGLTMAIAWLPAVCLVLIDGAAAPQFGAAWVLLPVTAAFVVVMVVFRQGRQLWRRAWAPDGTPL
ncbi:MAG: hypothetical protein J2P28_18225 [Actinobacteria bacterium]|nr:hypothetical protein [Actinomycetota bacterium]